MGGATGITVAKWVVRGVAVVGFVFDAQTQGDDCAIIGKLYGLRNDGFGGVVVL